MKWKNLLTAFGIEVATFCVCLSVDFFLDMKMLTPMIFILGVFLVSRYTEGYFYGIAVSVARVRKPAGGRRPVLLLAAA